ncbi:FAD-binding protein [Pseudomonas luteola]
MTDLKNTVTDVTQLYSVPVWAEVCPQSTQEVVDALARAKGPVSIGGGRYSMGGQVASLDSLHIDMRQMNRILSFDPARKTIRVQAGARWRDIQAQIDPYGLSISIMQTYANFTVGGAVSVNAHGRYIGYGPLIQSILEIKLVTASGDVINATPECNAEIFYGAIGGYGGIGVITEVVLKLADNVKVEKSSSVMPLTDYLGYFRSSIRDNEKVVFHNADIYPPLYNEVRAISWSQTDKPVTQKKRLHIHGKLYPLDAYFMWVISERPYGKWYRKNVLEPVLDKCHQVHWRNYEASYDVAELEPVSRKLTTYVLQEYFLPVDKIEVFVAAMSKILNRHKANVINISIRHAMPDPGSMLAWAQEEVFAFVLYYKQGTTQPERKQVAVWTRELIDAALSYGGRYYLPYQAHATLRQFQEAYPRHRELFDLKARMDPEFRFRNVLFDSYYKQSESQQPMSESDFKFVMGDTVWRDRMFQFLQSVFNVYKTDRFFDAIDHVSKSMPADDSLIYQSIQAHLPCIRKPLDPIRFALPALFTQKREMYKQAMQLLGDRRSFEGYMEIGSKGRYLRSLDSSLSIKGPKYFMEEKATTYSPSDILERGYIKRHENEYLLNDYLPLPSVIAANSIDLVLCYIGLHHAAPERVQAFAQSIADRMRPGGIFLLRDHDVQDNETGRFVSLIHTVFNLGLGESLEYDKAELRHFNSLEHWVGIMEEAGLRLSGPALYQDNDPSKNALMMFVKE